MTEEVEARLFEPFFTTKPLDVSRDPVQSGDQAAHLGHFAVGPDSKLDQRSKNRLQKG